MRRIIMESRLRKTARSREYTYWPSDHRRCTAAEALCRPQSPDHVVVVTIFCTDLADGDVFGRESKGAGRRPPEPPRGCGL